MNLLKWAASFIPRPYVRAQYYDDKPAGQVVIPGAIVIDSRHCVVLGEGEQCTVDIKWMTPREHAALLDDIPW